MFQTTKEEQIEILETEANREDISPSRRLALIYRIYELRGVPHWVYSGD